MMLVHLGQPRIAEHVHNAWLKTLEDGVHTYDIFQEGISKQRVGTSEFADAVIANLGKKPEKLHPVHYNTPRQVPKEGKMSEQNLSERRKKKETVGVDIFIEANGNGETLQPTLSALAGKDIRLTMIANRGVMVWPHKIPETTCGDTWRCRFMSSKKGEPITAKQIANLIQTLADEGIDFVQIEKLCTFDGHPGFSVAQDEQ
jgi:isocitrate dehydrogenase